MAPLSNGYLVSDYVLKWSTDAKNSQEINLSSRAESVDDQMPNVPAPSPARNRAESTSAMQMMIASSNCGKYDSQDSTESASEMEMRLAAVAAEKIGEVVREERESMRKELAVVAASARDSESKLKVYQDKDNKYAEELTDMHKRVSASTARAKKAEETTAENQESMDRYAQKLRTDVQAATARAEMAEAGYTQLAEELGELRAARDADATTAATALETEAAKVKELKDKVKVYSQQKLQELQELQAAKVHIVELDTVKLNLNTVKRDARKTSKELELNVAETVWTRKELELNKAAREADAKTAEAKLQAMMAQHLAITALVQELEVKHLAELDMVKSKAASTEEELEKLKQSSSTKAAKFEKSIQASLDYQLEQVEDLKTSKSALIKEAAGADAALLAIKGSLAFKLLSAIGCLQ